MPIFKCNICRRDIERSRELYIQKKGFLLCSSCLDEKIKNKTVNYISIIPDSSPSNRSIFSLSELGLKGALGEALRSIKIF